MKTSDFGQNLPDKAHDQQLGGNVSSSTYLRYRATTGRYVPFAPPLPSPKATEPLSLKQRLHYELWSALMRVWPMRYTGEPPLMLMGCHNSGTTILANLIGQHPAIVNWSEAPEVWTPDDAFLSWGNLSSPTHAQPFLFDMWAYQRTVAQHGDDLPLIRQSFAIYTATRRKGRFLNKNPHMSISIPYIEAAFPTACYIHIRRNGYAVVQSLLSNWRPVLQAVRDKPKTMGHWAQLREALDAAYFDDPLALVRQCARYWRDMDKAIEADLAKLPAERVYRTTYEAICKQPERVLREVFAQFDLSAAHYDWGQLRAPTRYPWAEMLPMQNRNFKYHERLSAAEIAAITDEVGPTLATYGYLHKD